MSGARAKDIIDASLCTCAECAADQTPKLLIEFVGQSAGFLVAFECSDCGQVSSGSAMAAWSVEETMKEVVKWNGVQDRVRIERAALEVQPSARRMRM